MELRHFRYFVAVAEALSFTKGAEKLRLAQPSLTRQIKDLEEEIGARLLDRTKRRVRLTEEGKFFLTQAKRILAQSAQTIEAVQRLSRHETAALNVGYVANLFCSLIPASLASFERLFPNVSITLSDMTCGDQFRALAEGRIDLGFVGFQKPIEERGLESRLIASYKTVAIVGKNSPLVKKAMIKLSDLKSVFFISVSEETYPGYREWLIATCQKVGFTPKILQDAKDERALIHAVEFGLGVAILPDQIKKLSSEGVVFRPINPSAVVESCVAWKKDNHSTVLKVFLQAIPKLANGPMIIGETPSVGESSI
jgi:DNA-binding transcriptional LysR family regulator